MHIIYLASSVFLLLPLLIDSFPNTPPTWPSSLGDSLVDSPSKRTLAQAPSEPILQIANATQVLPTSPLSPETPYTVEGTPVILNIATRDPLIPKIYLFASLTSVLRTIAPNVQDKPDDQIPGNRYVAYSRSSASGVGFVYIGTAAPRWLTWQELSWTLQVCFLSSAGSLGSFRALAGWARLSAVWRLHI